MNEKTKYTPGPWRYCREAISMLQDGYNIMGFSRLPLIATVAIRPDGDELNGHEPAFYDSVAKANAHLISAAPEMLGGLRFAVLCINNWIAAHPAEKTDWPEIAVSLKKTIAKAQGGGNKK